MSSMTDEEIEVLPKRSPRPSREHSDDDGERPIFSSPSTKIRGTKVTTSGGGPVTQFDVAFSDLTVTVRDRHDRTKRKELLSKVSGYVPKGGMLVVMGSSGCGKSTLLQAISHVSKPGTEVSGDVLYNSKHLRRRDRRQILSFVEQHSPLLGEFTVQETLWFAARLYFGYFHTPRYVIQEKVNSIITTLGLESCRDVVVGNLFFRGLSGGERKRLSIGVELISSPAVLVLDEPTTGLDSAVAMQLFQSLHRLTKVGHTVIATLHQPSSKMWKMFSHVLLMTQGKQVYFGQAKQAVDYFASIGFPCPENFNPSDYFSAILSIDFPMVDSKPAQELAELYEQSSLRKTELLVHLEQVDHVRKTRVTQGGYAVGTKKTMDPDQVIIMVDSIAAPPTTATANNNHRLATVVNDVATRDDKEYITRFDSLDFHSSFSGGSITGRKPSGRSLLGWLAPSSIKQSGFLSSAFTLLHRFLKSLYREPGLLLTRIVVYLSLGLLIGLIYLNIGLSLDTVGMLSRASVLLGLVGFFSFMSVSAIPFMLDNQQVMERERRNGSYMVVSYLVANILSLAPATLLLACIASVLVNLMCRLSNFGPFFFALWNLLFCAECLAQLAGSVARRSESGIALAVGTFAVMFVCSGFFVPVSEMNWAVRWIAYISPIRYAFRSFMRNELEGITVSESLQFPTGNDVLNYFDLNSGQVKSFWVDVAIVSGFAMSYILLMYLVIRVRVSD